MSSTENTNYKPITDISGFKEADRASVQKTNSKSSLPTNQQNGNGVNSNGKSGTVSQTINNMATNTNALIGSYSSLVGKVSELTGGAINLPTIKSGSAVAGILTGVNTAADILGTLTSGENGSRVQTNSVNVQPGAFKWVEFETQPREFVDYDSVLVFIGEPIYADNAKGEPFKPLGVCQSFQISSQLNVTTIQELRCEEQLIIPGKTSPIMINISRFCGVWPNLINRFHGVQENLKWNLSIQKTGTRDLFGLYVMVLDTSRQNIVTQFYIERCAINSYSIGITAGTMGVLDNVSLIAGRIIDPTQVTATDSTGKKVSTDGDISTNSEEASADEKNAALNADGEVNDDKYIKATDGTPVIGTITTESGKTMEVTQAMADEFDIQSIDANGNINYKDGSVKYKNGDIKEADGTYYDKQLTETYRNTSEFKECDKAEEKVYKAVEKQQEAESKYEESKQAYNEAVKAGADSDKLVKLAEKMSKQSEKVEQAKQNVTQKDKEYSASYQKYRNKVNQINAEKKVVELNNK